jgi:hypothetical protein
MAFTQTQMLQKEVYLFERIDAPNRERMGHFKAGTARFFIFARARFTPLRKRTARTLHAYTALHSVFPSSDDRERQSARGRAQESALRRISPL